MCFGRINGVPSEVYVKKTQNLYLVTFFSIWFINFDGHKLTIIEADS